MGVKLNTMLMSPNLTAGAGAAYYASSPAPAGFRWDFVTQNGARVTQDNEPVVALVRTV